MLWIFRINKNMNKRTGLRTKLEFRFGASDLEVPNMDFIMNDPPQKKKKEIRIIKKTRKNSKKTGSELF
jgi:hypothetical protein